MLRVLKIATTALVSVLCAPAFAESETLLGQPTPGALNFQEMVTPVGQATFDFHQIMLYVAFVIAIFVLILLVVTLVRFNEKANPVPRRFSHHVGIEVAWTVLPVVVLVALIGPSLNLLYFQEEIPEADVVVKATGNQWNWTYLYDTEGGEIEFTAAMVGLGYSNYEDMHAGLLSEGYAETDIPSQLEWKMDTTHSMVVPVNKVVQVVVTASDVIHSWAVPGFGVKVDAVPGRLTSTWFKATKEGTFYGQCSELCGKDHSYMPIEVQVVSEEVYAQWLANGGGEV